ncbi:MAG TPA: IPT/TIG domain-containing protein [Solirubrobacteraceae bacterium]|jgi:hypothetical protein|nr:IPT/TIG domain-containing protein [Solirubrobacteraceae bacterium]
MRRIPVSTLARRGLPAALSILLAACLAAPVYALARVARSASRSAGTPLVQQAKLTGGGEVGYAAFGAYLALSGDGETALATGIGDEPQPTSGEGSVWAFAHSGASWAQQGPKFKGGEMTELGQLGRGVAVSADGNMAVVLGYPGGIGAETSVWTFTRSGSSWVQSGARLEPDESPFPPRDGISFGESIALSADGQTMLIGGLYEEQLGKDLPRKFWSVAFVYKRSGSGWTQQGSFLRGDTENEEAEPAQVALSADGNTAMMGNYFSGEEAGDAWVFTRTGEAWAQQGGELKGGGEEVGAGRFGEALALSSDGDTALIGAPGDDGFKGAAFVLRRSGGVWTQPGSKLTASDERPGTKGEGARFGAAVSLSADGEQGLIGGPSDHHFKGAVWLFGRTGSSWAQEGAKMTAKDAVGNADFGQAVSLSADGLTALIGGPHDDGLAESPEALGAAWVFAAPAPVVKRVSPRKGPQAGGTTVTIKGQGLAEASAVEFGTSAATSFTVLSPTEISAASPPGSAGAVDVTVATPNGTSAVSAKDRFTYAP